MNTLRELMQKKFLGRSYTYNYFGVPFNRHARFHGLTQKIFILDSPRLVCSDAKLGGIILLKCEIEGLFFSKSEFVLLHCCVIVDIFLYTDLGKMKVDFSWAHTTSTMAVGYMALRDETPQVNHVTFAPLNI